MALLCMWLLSVVYYTEELHTSHELSIYLPKVLLVRPMTLHAF